MKKYIEIILAELTAICALAAKLTFNTELVAEPLMALIWAVIFAITLLNFDDIWNFMMTMDEKSEG